MDDSQLAERILWKAGQYSFSQTGCAELVPADPSGPLAEIVAIADLPGLPLLVFDRGPGEWVVLSSRAIAVSQASRVSRMDLQDIVRATVKAPSGSPVKSEATVVEILSASGCRFAAVDMGCPECAFTLRGILGMFPLGA